MISRVNIIDGKAGKANNTCALQGSEELGGLGLPLRYPKGLRRRSPEINLLDSTDHLVWLKADSNVAKEITVQNHKRTKTIYAFCHKI